MFQRLLLADLDRLGTQRVHGSLPLVDLPAARRHLLVALRPLIVVQILLADCAVSGGLLLAQGRPAPVGRGRQGLLLLHLGRRHHVLQARLHVGLSEVGTTWAT